MDFAKHLNSNNRASDIMDRFMAYDLIDGQMEEHRDGTYYHLDDVYLMISRALNKV